MTRILFHRSEALDIIRYTNINVTQMGSLWGQGFVSDADLETCRLNNWKIRIL